MDSKEILGLMEAYSEVYAPKENEEQLDELAPLVAGGLALGGAALAAKAIADRMSANRKKVTSSTPSGTAAKPSLSGAVQRRNQQMADVLKQSYEMDGELVDEELENFENWVNSLVEEGYDLSEYTWEEMYEEYLNEMGQTKTTGQATAPKSSAAKPQPQMRGLSIGQGGFRIDNKPVSTGMSPIFQRPGARPAAAPAARPSGAAPRPSAAPTARPAATAPRPAAAPAARPSGSSAAKPPSAKPATPTPTTAPKPKTPNPLMQRTFGYQTGNAPDQQRARADAIVKSGAVAALKPATSTAKPTPTPTRRPGGSVKPGSLVSGFDMFDVVKGYLIDEGYAETEESAIAIMANMSEEWKEVIISEAVKGTDTEMRKAASAERRRGDKPLPKKEGERYSKFKAHQIDYIDKKTKGKYIHGMTRG